jgi:hypothetical protein
MDNDRVSHGLGRAEEFWMVTMVDIFSSLPHRKAATVVTGAQAS